MANTSSPSDADPIATPNPGEVPLAEPGDASTSLAAAVHGEAASKPSMRIAISRLAFSDGTAVELGEDDVVLIVGPNNAGKSATLRAIRDKFQNPAVQSPVLEQVATSRRGTLTELLEWLGLWAIRNTDAQPANPLYHAVGASVYQSQIQYEWERTDGQLSSISRWFCHMLTADERLQLCNPPVNIALARDPPTHPFHYLQRDDKLELRISEKFRRAFGLDLVVHRNAGSQVPVHVGQRPQPEPDEDRVSITYVERVERLPTLHTQGDGMRSFAGVLLATSVGRENIMLIDEPEAFLHPPQARLLGRTLVQDRGPERQLFIATHSTDVVRGVLDTESSSVRVLRIRREGTRNVVRLLDNNRIRELWSDPLLRYSNILDGLFHERVVVCESDSDCRFYSAILDSIQALAGADASRPDLMFTHCGGKARLPVVIRALREVDVPVKAVADFDVLSDELPLKHIAEALGLKWEEVERDWRQVKGAVDAKRPDLSTAEVKDAIEKILSRNHGSSLSQKAKSEISALLKRSSAWASAKTLGKAFVPSGDATKACDRLLARLRSAGLYVVEVGELEGFARSEPGHGPQWVNSVLARALATDPELSDARAFVSALAEVKQAAGNASPPAAEGVARK